MTCLCLVIGPGDSGVAADLPGPFDKLAIRAVYAGRPRVGQEFLEQLRFDVILIDEAESHENALAWLAALQDRDTPIILLRRAFSVRQEVELLEAGAGEVVDRAASPQLIALKVAKAAKASHRAHSAAQRTTLRLGRLQLNPQRLLALLGDVPLALTRRQFDLLFLLALSAGQFVHRAALEGSMRLGANDVHRGVDMQISRIRKSLRAAGGSSFLINSAYGYGYCLMCGDEESVSVPSQRSDPMRQADGSRTSWKLLVPAPLQSVPFSDPFFA